MLNGPEVRNQAETFYGKIQHPTIVSIVQMILDFYDHAKLQDPTLTWDDIILWKKDLKGAYTLEDVKLFGMELSNDPDSPAGPFAILFLPGIFGWTETPYTFQVITCACLRAEEDDAGPVWAPSLRILMI